MGVLDSSVGSKGDHFSSRPQTTPHPFSPSSPALDISSNCPVRLQLLRILDPRIELAGVVKKESGGRSVSGIKPDGAAKVADQRRVDVSSPMAQELQCPIPLPPLPGLKDLV